MVDGWPLAYEESAAPIVTAGSHAGQGATFIVRLPVAASPPQPASPLPSGWG